METGIVGLGVVKDIKKTWEQLQEQKLVGQVLSFQFINPMQREMLKCKTSKKTLQQAQPLGAWRSKRFN